MDLVAVTELSEGEIVEEAPTADCNEPDLDGGDHEPKAKKRKLEDKPEESAEKDGGDWETVPSKKQLKKKMKNRQRDKRIHQQLEDKHAAMTSHAPTQLHPRQAEVVEFLARIASGDQQNRAMVQKLKTIQFQGVISHLVTGSPSLGSTLHSSGAGDLCRDYKVVVVWMSLVSSDFFRNHSSHFAEVKKLRPCVMFDIEHPGSTRFVKLGLESFMMLASTEDGSTPHGASVAAESPTKVVAKPRWAYLFNMDELSDNDFPNPSRQGGVDQLGREISTYSSVVEWPSCEVCVTPEVSAAKEGGTGGMPMFAVDCEMVETRLGSELARISIVNESLECIYDTYVKPDCPVVDYRTKYSGLSEEILDGVTTTLKDIQASLPSLLPANSILIGHSLENDFHAMKFRHPFVIDTSLIFTPLAVPTGKPGLRRLCKELLAMDIQKSDQGHDSIEDATTCMKLVHLKLEKGESCKIAFNEISPSIFTEYRTQGHTTGIVDKESIIRLFGRGSSFSAEAKTDQEVVSCSAGIISQSKFTFIQLHSMEYLLKSENGKDEVKIKETAELMDSHVCKVVEGCPPKTLVFVVCGSSDIRKVRRMQQEDIPNLQQLRKQVMLARTGCVVGFIVN